MRRAERKVAGELSSSGERKGRSETSPYFLDAFELDGVSLVGSELGDVEAIVVDE